MEVDSWKNEVKRHLNGLVQTFKQRNDSKALAEYFISVGNDLDQMEPLNFEAFQQFWYRHKRVVALQDVKRQISNRSRHARNEISDKSSEISYTSRKAENEFDGDEILSITDSWDIGSERLLELRSEIKWCLEEDQDFFSADQMSNSPSPGNELAEAGRAFDEAEKDANGAYRVLKKQVLALKLRALVPEAILHCTGSSIPKNKRVTTYLAEKCWSNLPARVQKEKHEKLARWRGHGEKWLSLKEPAIVLAFNHVPSDHRSFNDFERRRFPMAAFDAVVGTLQAVSIIHDLRRLWCRQLIRKRVKFEFHPEQCFCQGHGTDTAFAEGAVASSIINHSPAHGTVEPQCSEEPADDMEQAHTFQKTQFEFSFTASNKRSCLQPHCASNETRDTLFASINGNGGEHSSRSSITEPPPPVHSPEAEETPAVLNNIRAPPDILPHTHEIATRNISSQLYQGASALAAVGHKMALLPHPTPQETDLITAHSTENLG
ncbi:hypothetical protein LOZ64_006543, partial [Ophidiomyces ophidiicola]